MERSPAEERKEVLIFGAIHGRSDIISAAVDEERKDPLGSVNTLLQTRGEHGETALHIVCRLGHVDAARLLLTRGAGVEDADAAGRTPYQTAEQAEAFASLRSVFQSELFTRLARGEAAGTASLLRARMDVNCEQGGYTPAAWAALFKQHCLVDMLARAARGESLDAGAVNDSLAVPVDSLSVAASSPLSTPPQAVEQSLECQISTHLDTTEDALPPVFPWLWPPCLGQRLGESEVCTLALQTLQLVLPMELDASDVEELAEVLDRGIHRTFRVGVPRLSLCMCSLDPLDGNVHTLRHPCIVLSLDQRMLPPHGFRIICSPTSGCVEVAAHDACSLRSAVECVHQILSQGELNSRRELVLPAAVVENVPSTGQATAVLIDIWSLSASVASAALVRLRAWQVTTLYTPVQWQQSTWEVEVRRVIRLRKECRRHGQELVPVLTVDTSLEGPDESARGRLCRILASFGSVRSVGLRFRCGLEEQCARINEVQRLACEVFRTHRAPLLLCWLPATEIAVRSFCERTRPLQSGLAVMLEGGGGHAAATLRSRSVPHYTFIGAEQSPLSRVPLPICTRGTVPARLSGLNIRVLEGRRHRALGAVVEVPVFGAPWCGLGTAFPTAWCELTGFIAASVGASTSPLVVEKAGDTEGNSDLRTQRASLLATHLLQAPCRGEEEIGKRTRALASALWDTPTTADSRLLSHLVTLLSGELPPAAVMQDGELMTKLNQCYSELSQSRQRAQANLDRLRSESASWAQNVVVTLEMVVSGLEWLRFACRLLLLCKKYPVELSGSDRFAGCRQAVSAFPPAKHSDARNKFLALVEGTYRGKRTSPQQVEDEFGKDDASRATWRTAAMALWSGGLKLGAALDLEPWVEFETSSSVEDEHQQLSK